MYSESYRDIISAFKGDSYNVTIQTHNGGFINRTTISDNNQTNFIVSNMRFKGANFLDKQYCTYNYVGNMNNRKIFMLF